MKDYRLMSSPIFWAVMTVIIILHIASAVMRVHKKGNDPLIITAINILLHLGLCVFMLINRADSEELLLALLISLAANLASRSIRRKGGKKDGI